MPYSKNIYEDLQLFLDNLIKHPGVLLAYGFYLGCPQ